jgi:predicted nucleic acid-binding protein
MTRGVTLDAGALIAIDRDDRRVVALLVRAQETSARVTIPAPALAQAVRNPARQARLARLVRQPATDVVALDRADATGVGRLLSSSGTADVVDAHVVLCARRTGQAVATSDPDDLHHLDPTLTLVTV